MTDTPRYPIAIPHRDPDQTLGEALIETTSAEASEQLDPEARAVAAGMLIDAAGECRTVGELLDRLDQADPDELRHRVDQARRTAGLPTLDEAKAARRFEMTQAALRQIPQRDGDGAAYLTCSADGCNAVPVHPRNGMPVKSKARRYWCPDHADQAGPNDHLPPEHGHISARFRPMPSPDEAAQLERDEAKRRRDSERRKAGRQAEADALERIARRYQEENPTRVMGLPVQGHSDA